MNKGSRHRWTVLAVVAVALLLLMPPALPAVPDSHTAEVQAFRATANSAKKSASGSSSHLQQQQEDSASSPVEEAGRTVLNQAVTAHAATVTGIATARGGSSSSTPLPSVKLPHGPPGQRIEISSVSDLTTKFPLADKPRPAIEGIWDHCSFTLPSADDLASQQSTVLDHLTILVGRTRLTCRIGRTVFREVESLREFLWKKAPAWYLPSSSSSTGESSDHFTIKRRVKAFTFAVTGGPDGRAAFVERTWGTRTPIVWFADRWSDALRPIVDLHPKFKAKPFEWFTFQMTRIWQRVFTDYYSDITEYDWYIRLWDDTYYNEENVYNCLGRLDPLKPQMAGKIGWRYLGDKAIFPFAGGGAGWYLSRAGLQRYGPTILEAEDWIPKFRARRDIFLPHDIHDEDVFLTAWLHMQNVTFVNIPGVEHVSPGMGWRQRCMTDDTLKKLRWDPNTTIFFDYPAHESLFRIEESWYAHWKPIVWHYMSPSRLVKMETLLYPERKPDFATTRIPLTSADQNRPTKKCYPGFPAKGGPFVRGKSVFEVPLPDPKE